MTTCISESQSASRLLLAMERELLESSIRQVVGRETARIPAPTPLRCVFVCVYICVCVCVCVCERERERGRERESAGGRGGGGVPRACH